MTGGAADAGAIPAVVLPGTMRSADQPILAADGGLSLRPFRRGDEPAILAAFADPLIVRWHTRRLTHTQQATTWIERWGSTWAAETDARWAVVDPGRGEVVGQVGLREVRLSDGVAEISYWVRPAARGAGIAGRAARAVSAWAFADLGLHRLSLMHSTANAASCRVASAAGFEAEGTLRSALLHADGWHDMHLHSLLAP